MSARRSSPRHPSARARGDDLAFTARSVLARQGTAASRMGVDGPEEAVAVAAMVVRGRERRTREQFAVAYGLDAALVERIERGFVARSQVPSPLVHLTPLGRILHDW
ncbi:MAG: hypothetical protein GX643_11110 [Acidimicrobiales bacterium]|nr:hypothetical protein [Acidimicrobiales bacterium]